MFFKQSILILLVVSASFGANNTAKRGIFDSGYGGFNSFDNFGHNGLSAGLSGSGLSAYGPGVLFSKTFSNYRPYSPSPGEIASAIQAAKEASAGVMSAQHRVQEAKEEVLHQQHVASQKQAQAALALQKTEAAAAVQQQEAKSAATALVHAQQRLAQAKAEVAEYQKIASAKEAHAAAVIQKSATAAAAEIQRTDEAARKINAIQHSGTTTLKQAAAGKEGTLSATSAAVAASIDTANANSHVGNGHGGVASWYSAPKFVHISPWG